jgi:hypothetical protein
MFALPVVYLEGRSEYTCSFALSSTVVLTSKTLLIYVNEASPRNSKAIITFCTSEVVHRSYDKFNLVLEDYNILVSHFYMLLPGKLLERSNKSSKFQEQCSIQSQSLESVPALINSRPYCQILLP